MRFYYGFVFLLDLRIEIRFLLLFGGSKNIYFIMDCRLLINYVKHF